MEALEIASIQGNEQSYRICDHLAHLGSLEALKWVRRVKHHTFIESESESDSESESTNRLRLSPAPWSTETFKEAISGDHIEVVNWLYEQKCLWDESTFAAAVKGGGGGGEP